MKFEEIQLPEFKRVIPDPALAICVIIPVKNEARHLRTTLESLLNQLHEDGTKFDFGSYEVLLLINNSDDESLQIATEFKLSYTEFPLNIAEIELPGALANIGTVRRLLMNEAYRRFNFLGNNRGIIASIDGDTAADNHWLHHIRKEIDAGNDAVGGLITINEKAGSAEQAYLRDMEYRYLLTEVEQLLCPQINDPLPRHFHFFGANMAVTAEYYYKSGGIPEVDCLEDMAFHTALLRCDARIRRSTEVKVVTSARFDGRVAIGFSEQLRKWSNENQERIPQVVEDSELHIYSCFLKGQLQTFWKSKGTSDRSLSIEGLAPALGVSGEWLKAQLHSHKFFGTFWEDVWSASSVRQRKHGVYEPIQSAIKKLKKFTRNPDISAFQTNPTGIFQRDTVLYV